MKENRKITPLDTQQSIDFGDLKQFLETNSNLKKQDQEHNNKYTNDNLIDDNLINRNNLKTLKQAENLIKKKSQMNNPYINNPQGTKNNSKQFDKDSSFDDDMVNLELSQEDNPNYQTNDMFDISGTSSSFADNQNDNELFDDVFNNPQGGRIDCSEFNKKRTKKILIEDNYDKTNII